MGLGAKEDLITVVHFLPVNAFSIGMEGYGVLHNGGTPY